MQTVMFEPPMIAPSILSADFMNIEHDIHMIEEAGAHMIHVDVMDGHFVSNLTMGPAFVSQLKKITKLPLDVHLMVSNPLCQLPWFLALAPYMVTVHLESFSTLKGDRKAENSPAFETLNSPVYATEKTEEALSLIRASSARVGLALKPDTPLVEIIPYLDKVDMVLIMSVYPGFSGQSYIPTSTKRIADLVLMAREIGVSPLIGVDGGIDLGTVALPATVGADMFVAGNAIFASGNPQAALKDIAWAAASAQATQVTEAQEAKSKW
jgi:ribulose-phosphate 3-epimerase